MDKEKLLTNKYILGCLAVFCCILWGSAASTIKIGYQLFAINGTDSATQILFAGLRFTMAGILTVMFGSLLGRQLLFPKKTSWGNVLLLAMLQTVVQYILFYIGVAHTTGVKAAIVVGVEVFVCIFVSCFIFRSEKMTANKLVGSLIGIAGIILVNLNGIKTGLTPFTILGDGFIILSTVAYAVSSSCIKIFSKKENPVVLSGYQFLLGGLIMIIIGFFMGGRIRVFSAGGMLILLYLSFVSAAAYTIWGLLLKYNPVSKVAIYGFVNPLCGVFLSAFLLDESAALGVSCIGALVLVCAGIFIANRR